jgi:phage baseplate assembly protein gpV
LNLNLTPTLNNSNTEILSRNTGTGQVEYTALSAFTSLDTFVTGFTYNPSTNTFTVSQNQGQPDLTASINSVSGLSFSNLTQGRVVYVGPGGLLTDESTFTYNDGTNTLSVDNIEAAGSVVIQGDLTVLGAAISAFTSNLYVEDPNITLNYNPTGSTVATSVNAGFTIQDGNGVSGGSVNFDIVRMQNLTGLTGTQVPSVTEYTALTGYPNRGWVTQLNDIVIRSTDPTDDGSFNGVRVLAEFDILDAGSY